MKSIKESFSVAWICMEECKSISVDSLLQWVRICMVECESVWFNSVAMDYPEKKQKVRFGGYLTDL